MLSEFNPFHTPEKLILLIHLDRFIGSLNPEDSLWRQSTVWLYAYIQAWAVSTALDNSFSRMFQVKNVSSGMGLVSIDVSEKRAASNCKVVKIRERRKVLPVANRRSHSSKETLTIESRRVGLG
jgi:hypothetical protein